MSSLNLATFIPKYLKNVTVKYSSAWDNNKMENTIDDMEDFRMSSDDANENEIIEMDTQNSPGDLQSPSDEDILDDAFSELEVPVLKRAELEVVIPDEEKQKNATITRTSKGKTSSKKSKVKNPVVVSNEPKFEKRYADAFGAIVTFIKDLWSVFATKNITPLSLYNRLVDHIKFTDINAILKATTGFAEFFNLYGKDIFANTLQNIPIGTKINYGDGKVHIPIQMYIHRSEPEIRESIRQHLMTIVGFIQPEKIESFKTNESSSGPGSFNIDTSTTEGKFIDGIMKKANSSMEGVDASNPMMATMQLFQSGIMGDMITGLQQGVGSGQMDMMKLMGMMQGAMGSMMGQTPNSSSPSKPEEVSVTPQNPKTPGKIVVDKTETLSTVPKAKAVSKAKAKKQ